MSGAEVSGASDRGKPATKPAVKLPAMPPELRAAFEQAYRFRQRHQHPSREREFWRDAAKDMSATAALDNHPFAKALLLCCYQDIERELLENEPPEQLRL